MTFFTLFFRFFRFMFYFCLLTLALCLIIFVFLIFSASKDLPRVPSPLSKIIETPRTEIFAATGENIMTLGSRQPVPLSRVSPYFIKAVVATEDHRFWDHHGINKLRTVKALFITLFEPGKIQGASTITQQLAKNLFFSFKKSYLRKFREMLVAFQIEATSDKKEILNAYINQINFGAGAQGIEKASEVFFGKSAADLTLGEAALLAGLPKSPTYYNPFKYYDRALKRRAIVLKRMVDVGYISEKEAEDVLMTKPVLCKKHGSSVTGSYFVDALINRLVAKYGEDIVFHGGIKVFTTLDTELQSYAEKSMQKGIDRVDKMMGISKNNPVRPQGALVAVDTGSGAIKAMVGGRDYSASEFNRAVNSRRQPGSGFKPFLYYTAFKEFDLNGASVMTDKPVTIKIKGSPDWKPENFERSYMGNVILKKALALSINTIAAQLVDMTGPEAVVETARKCGIISPLKNVYSVCLGTSGVSPLEMASAFSTFANLGIRHRPFYIWRVEDSFGRVIYEHIVQSKRVLDADTAFQIVDMMESVINSGSGKSVRAMGFNRPAAGKTGTSDHFNDAWFTGFTPSLSTSVWIGFDKKRKLITKNHVGITGGRGAAPIWADFMKQALKNEPLRDFPVPEGIRFEFADSVTGCKINENENFVNKFQSNNVDNGHEIFRIPLKRNQYLCQSVNGQALPFSGSLINLETNTKTGIKIKHEIENHDQTGVTKTVGPETKTINIKDIKQYNNKNYTSGFGADNTIDESDIRSGAAK